MKHSRQTLSNKSYLTAISRKDLPIPVKFLIEDDRIHGKVLDYGCGKCFNLNPPKWDNYDPYYHPAILHANTYDTILCTYVLCTLPKREHLAILNHIRWLLDCNFGIAYITVRKDKPKQGWGISSRGTFQEKVRLPFPIVHQTSQYIIYSMTADTMLI